MMDTDIQELLLSLADDELVLGHRDAEWTGHGPILEEDMAFSNIAQDEIGHALVWYSLLEPITGKSPDWMGFHRPWQDFRCCRFVCYPKGDFAYTVMRQYLFDVAEQVRLNGLADGSHKELQDAAARILKEEHFHLLHTEGLVLRLGDATEESHLRMQNALTAAVPQAVGIFEPLSADEALATRSVLPVQSVLLNRWLEHVVPILKSVSLDIPITSDPDFGGRRGDHSPHLTALVTDLQRVVQSQPEARW